MKSFGTWSVVSSFSLGGMIGCVAGGAMIIVGALPALTVLGAAIVIGVIAGIAISGINWLTGHLSGEINKAATAKISTRTVSGKMLTGAVVAGYVAISAVAVSDVSNSKAPEAYDRGYEAGMSEIQSIEGNNSNAENTQPLDNEQAAVPTKKPTKTPTSRPNPTKTKTPQPSYPTLYADQNYNCRESPWVTANHVADIPSGTSYRIIGRASNGWYAIAISFSTTSHTYCWIGGGNVSGDLSTVKYYEVQPPAQANGNLPIYDLNSFVNHWDQGQVIGYLSCDQVTSIRWDYVACGDIPHNCYLSQSTLFGYNSAVLKTEEVHEICGFVP